MDWVIGCVLVFGMITIEAGLLLIYFVLADIREHLKRSSMKKDRSYEGGPRSE